MIGQKVDHCQEAIVGKISKDVLNLGFMKRTTVRIEKQKKIQQQQEIKEAIASGKISFDPPSHYPTVEHVDDDPEWTIGGVMSEWRYSVLVEQRFGRFSYNGQNPEIEKLMEFHERRRLGLADPDEQKDYDGNSDEDNEREEGELSSDDEENGHAIGQQEADSDFRPPTKKFRHDNAHSRQNRRGPGGGMDETWYRNEQDDTPLVFRQGEEIDVGTSSGNSQNQHSGGRGGFKSRTRSRKNRTNRQHYNGDGRRNNSHTDDGNQQRRRGHQFGARGGRKGGKRNQDWANNSI